MRATCKSFALAGLWLQVSLAQGPPVVIQFNTENAVRYVYDTSDFAAFATVQTPINQVFPTFGTWVTEQDIVSVNGKPAKGIYLTRQVAINLSPTPPPGQGIADLTATNIVDRILVFLQPDGTPIGSIMMLGLDGGNPPPGAPVIARQGNFAITGGTGAFLGMRGQFVSGPTIPGEVATRTASVREDPSKRRINGGGKAIFVLHLIPMTRPEVAAILHADFSPVTAEKPAKAGEVLVARATGLGPTTPAIDPGQPFPMDTRQDVNSPVEVSVNGKPAEVLNKFGWPGGMDTYRVDFRVPEGTAPGLVGLQVTAAWIGGSTVNFPVQ